MRILLYISWIFRHKRKRKMHSFECWYFKDENNADFVSTEARFSAPNSALSCRWKWKRMHSKNSCQFSLEPQPSENVLHVDPYLAQFQVICKICFTMLHDLLYCMMFEIDLELIICCSSVSVCVATCVSLSFCLRGVVPLRYLRHVLPPP